ncbi:MAG: DNA-processing protein DprA [Bacteroidales bacterium]|nr:DNA-processing protein DprA [Bacteroidales bacterium]
MDKLNVFLNALNRALVNSPAQFRKLIETASSQTEPEIFLESFLNACAAGNGGKYCEKYGLAISDHAMSLLSDSASIEDSKREIEWMERRKVRILNITDNDYPQLLLECNDAPPVLYCRGEISWNRWRCCAFVGTRLPSAYGLETTVELVRLVSGYGVTVVSGLAYGIDIAAHKAALENSGRTVAVLPNGIDSIYPSSHRDHAAQIVRQGAVVTEFPLGTSAMKMNFIKRNRIIAGMSDWLVLPESRIHGGAMTTAQFACSYGRELFAVPGKLSDTNSGGCNYLLSKKMAETIYRPEQLCESMGLGTLEFGHRTDEKELFFNDSDKKRKIMLTLKDISGRNADEICQLTGIPFSEVSLILLELELSGTVRNRGSDIYSLA